jgi:hypothetical protein
MEVELLNQLDIKIKELYKEVESLHKEIAKLSISFKLSDSNAPIFYSSKPKEESKKEVITNKLNDSIELLIKDYKNRKRI